MQQWDELTDCYTIAKYTVCPWNVSLRNTIIVCSETLKTHLQRELATVIYLHVSGSPLLFMAPMYVSLTHLWCIETHTRTGNSYSTYLRQSLMSCRQCITWLTALFNAHSKWDNKIMWANEGSVRNPLWKAKIWWYCSTTTREESQVRYMSTRVIYIFHPLRLLIDLKRWSFKLKLTESLDREQRSYSVLSFALKRDICHVFHKVS